MKKMLFQIHLFSLEHTDKYVASFTDTAVDNTNNIVDTVKKAHSSRP